MREIKWAGTAHWKKNFRESALARATLASTWLNFIGSA
jgi:hypothetical protein